jgi:hypothetical protein
VKPPQFEARSALVKTGLGANDRFWREAGAAGLSVGRPVVEERL